jgi:hypothetical protein
MKYVDSGATFLKSHEVPATTGFDVNAKCRLFTGSHDPKPLVKTLYLEAVTGWRREIAGRKSQHLASSYPYSLLERELYGTVARLICNFREYERIT